MKRKQQLLGWGFTALGGVILLLALVFYAVSSHSAEISLGHAHIRLDKGMVTMGACVLGIYLIVLGTCRLWVKASKQEEIEAKDERNIALANEAKAGGYEIMTVLFSLALAAAGFLRWISTPVFFLFFAVFMISQAVFIIRLWHLHKTK